MEKNMKTFFNLLCLTAMAVLIIGCSEMISPLDSPSRSDGGAPVRPSTISFEYSETLGFIYYPAGYVSKGDVTNSKLVTAKDGGKVKADFEYMSLDGKKTHVHAELQVPKGAVDQDVNITMTLDTIVVGVKFEPEGLVFNQPAKLDFHVDHLNQIPNDPPIGFYYVDDGGNFSPVSYDQLDNHMHPDHSDLNLNNAYIPHFSIYAFGR